MEVIAECEGLIETWCDNIQNLHQPLQRSSHFNEATVQLISCMYSKVIIDSIPDKQPYSAHVVIM